jgi:hypothetical protein
VAYIFLIDLEPLRLIYIEWTEYLLCQSCKISACNLP